MREIMKDYIKQASVILKEGVYKKDSILLVALFPALCILVGAFSIVDYTLKVVYG